MFIDLISGKQDDKIAEIEDKHDIKIAEIEENVTKTAEETNRRLAHLKQDYEDNIATVVGKIY